MHDGNGDGGVTLLLTVLDVIDLAAVFLAVDITEVALSSGKDVAPVVTAVVVFVAALATTVVFFNSSSCYHCCCCCQHFCCFCWHS